MILLSTASLKWYGLHRIFNFAKEADYDGIDLVLTPKDFDCWDSDYVKKLSDDTWVKVLSIVAPTRGLNEKKVDKIIKLASYLDVQNVTFAPPYFRDSNITWYTKYLARVKRETQLSISIKNVEPKFLLFIIPEYKKSSLFEIKKVTWDTSLDLSAVDSSSGSDILKAEKILWSSIRNIYISDKYWPKKGLLPGWAWGGISYLPLESFFMKLRTTWYSSFITLSITPKEMWVGIEEKVLQNLEYFKKYYEKHFLSYK